MLPDEEARFEVARSIPSIASHMPRIFYRLPEQIDDYMMSTKLNERHPLALFFAWVKENVDAERYAEIADTHLSLKHLRWLAAGPQGSFEHKYLNFPGWGRGKFAEASRLGLRTGKFKRMLDLGCGPGHFGLVARYLGVEFVGLDIDQTVFERPGGEPLYDELIPLFELERVTQRIIAFTPVEVPGRFDLVTCTMGTFAAYFSTSKASLPRGWPEWAWFLDQLVRDVMVDGEFRMLFHIIPKYFASFVDKLQPFCVSMTPERGYFELDHTLDREALAAEAYRYLPRPLRYPARAFPGVHRMARRAYLFR